MYNIGVLTFSLKSFVFSFISFLLIKERMERKVSINLEIFFYLFSKKVLTNECTTVGREVRKTDRGSPSAI
ncbi:hypothetical protein KLEB273_gp004 [Bacillus phage vB_BauM_KLEB27-3]|nr:hypothetical protein KLEB273_gp004 [Bacillus phage vB_BauM_KLEB27-3]